MGWTVITGASGGIGLELAKLLAAERHKLMLVARGERALTDAARQLEAAGAEEVETVALDLADPSAVDRLIEALRTRRIDLLVNNAGRGDFGRFNDVEPDAYHTTMMLNMVALTQLMRAVLPQMVARGSGQVVNLASTASFQPLPWMAVYGATKAYVLSLTEAVAHEYRGTGVSILAICPGATATGFASAADAGTSGNFAAGATADAVQVAAYAMREMRRHRSGVAIHGVRNRVNAALAGVAPRRLVLNMAERQMRPNRQSARYLTERIAP